MSKALINVSNYGAGYTSCPAFFIQKFKIFSKFSADQLGEKKDRKTQKKIVKHAKQTKKEITWKK
tara:strand:- start:397 stop:591 length:195 start_codon:yes stop_codon:yes gene_type:complete